MKTARKNLSTSWRETNLSDIAEIIMGQSPASSFYNQEGIGLPFFQGKADFTNSQKMKTRYWTSQSTKLSEPGDILLSVRAPVGDVAINQVHACIGRGLAALRGRREVCNQSFLFQLMLSLKADLNSKAQGSTFTAINGPALKKIGVTLPPLLEQKKIAEILSTVDGEIQKTDEIILKTEKLKSGLMQELFTKGIKHRKFKKTKIGVIPEEWELKTIGDIKSFITSGSRGWAQYYSSSGPIFLRIGNLTRKHVNLRLEDKVYVTPPSTGEGLRTRVQPGDVLISITADLGIVGLVPPTIGEAYVNQHIALVRFGNIEVFSPWIAHFLSSSIAQKQFLSSDDRGTKSGLNLPKVENILIALPKRTEQEKIVNILTSIDQKIAAAHDIKTELISLKKSLTQDLLSGKVKVL